MRAAARHLQGLSLSSSSRKLLSRLQLGFIYARLQPRVTGIQGGMNADEVYFHQEYRAVS